MRVNSRPRGYNGTLSAFADTTDATFIPAVGFCGSPFFRGSA
jgi:hypothetical protein